MNNKSVITTQNLAIGYNTKVMHANINLNIHLGDCIVVVGKNGIGKSTLLKTLIGLQKPLNGNIFINSNSIKKIKPTQLAKHVSAVLTTPISSKNFTVFELVALGRQPYTNWLGKLTTKDVDVINKSLELTNVSKLANAKCYVLSDGQLQRVLIAKALAQDTNIIVLDEPTTHLDLSNKAQLFKLLNKLSKEEQKTIIFSTHDINWGLSICNKALVITNDNVILDTVKNHINKNRFDSIFENNTVTFDAIGKTFKLNTTKPLSLKK